MLLVAKIAKLSINAPCIFLKSLYLLKNFVAKNTSQKIIKRAKNNLQCLVTKLIACVAGGLFRFSLPVPVVGPSVK